MQDKETARFFWKSDILENVMSFNIFRGLDNSSPFTYEPCAFFPLFVSGSTYFYYPCRLPGGSYEQNSFFDTNSNYRDINNYQSHEKLFI
jgi:hypothetical protein